MTLIDIINHVQNNTERFNVDTFLNDRNFGQLDQDDNKLRVSYNYQYILDNLFVAGYNDVRKINFQIFKDHCGWQIWLWGFSENKKECNQFNAPYYRYDDVRKFIANNIL